MRVLSEREFAIMTACGRADVTTWGWMMKVLMWSLGVALAGCASDPVALMPNGSDVRGRSFRPTVEDPAVVLECTVGEKGALNACAVVEETHPGQGFAEAALQSVDEARMAPRQGRVGEKVRFTMRFRADSGAP